METYSLIKHHRIPVVTNQEIISVDAHTVLYIEARDKQSIIHTMGVDQLYLTNDSISVLEHLLNSIDFVRIHRSFLVNMEHYCKCRTSKSATVTLTTGKILPISASYRANFLHMIHPKITGNNQLTLFRV